MLDGLKVPAIVYAKVWIVLIGIVTDQFNHTFNPLGIVQGVKPSLHACLDAWEHVVPFQCVAG
jgi:hypothetical protein